MTNQTYTVIVPAAGIGSRMKSNVAKQYLKINHQTILEITLTRLLQHPNISNIIVVLNAEDKVFETLAISNREDVTAIVGGKERVDSVLAGLHYCKSKLNLNKDYVLVHDAARPCFTFSSITSLVSEERPAILAIPCSDTLKKSHAQATPTIEKTIDRNSVWRAQTPQFAPIDMMIASIENVQERVLLTDEASALEANGHKVAMVEGASSNIKITHPEDLELASFYLAKLSK